MKQIIKTQCLWQPGKIATKKNMMQPDPIVYVPSLSNDGTYIDKMPSFVNNPQGYICSCGSRKDKVYTNHSKLAAHFKTTTHTKWLEMTNSNKHNVFEDVVMLRDTTKHQAQLLTQKENEINVLKLQLSDKDRYIDNLLQSNANMRNNLGAVASITSTYNPDLLDINV